MVFLCKKGKDMSQPSWVQDLEEKLPALHRRYRRKVTDRLIRFVNEAKKLPVFERILVGCDPVQPHFIVLVVVNKEAPCGVEGVLKDSTVWDQLMQLGTPFGRPLQTPFMHKEFLYLTSVEERVDQAVFEKVSEPGTLYLASSN